MHPFREERHGRADHSPPWRCRFGAVARPLGRPACDGPRCVWSEDVPQRPLWPPSAAHGLLDIYLHDAMKGMQPPGVEPGRPTQRVLGPLPYRLGHGCRVRAVGFEPTQGLNPSAPRAGAVVRLATHAMRPAGFEPAITAVSERRVVADHKSAAMPGYATGARVAAESLRHGRVRVRRRLLGRPRMAPPGFEPGMPRSRRSGIPVSPRGCVHRQDRTEAADDGGAHTPDVKTPTAPRTRFSV